MTDPAVLRPAEAPTPAASVRRARIVTQDSGAVAMPAQPPRRSRGRLATWALGTAMIALSVSWFTEWALPVAILAILLALVTLIARRAQPGLAWWALGLALGAVACSMCWIVWGLRAAAKLAGG